MDEETAPYVREAFARAAGGDSVRKVARWVASLPTSTRGGRNLGYAVTRRLLSSAVYVACVKDMVDGEDVLSPGKWPALIDRAAWDRVQAKIGQHKQLPRQATGRFLLTGMIRCPRLRAAPLRDHARQVRPDLPLQRDLPEGGLGARPSVSICHLPATDRRVRAARGDSGGGCRHIDGDIDKAGYEALRDKVEADLDNADAEIARLRATRTEAVRVPPLDEVLREAGGWSEALRSVDVPRQRQALAAVVTCILPKRVGRRQCAADIDWTPRAALLRELVAHALEPVTI